MMSSFPSIISEQRRNLEKFRSFAEGPKNVEGIENAEGPKSVEVLQQIEDEDTRIYDGNDKTTVLTLSARFTTVSWPAK